jgi:hypothetical protein
MRRSMIRWCLKPLLAFVWLCCSPGVAQAQEDKVYNAPRFFDHRLDWCATWGAECGQPAADTFCKRRRYTAARNFLIEPNIGDREPTMTIRSKQVCDKNFCAGFKSITCRDPISSERVFVNPVWNEYRLDACVQWGSECGKPAADAFCRHQGYARAFFEVLDASPGYANTRLIGSNQICDKKFCVGFQMIVCE